MVPYPEKSLEEVAQAVCSPQEPLRPAFDPCMQHGFRLLLRACWEGNANERFPMDAVRVTLEKMWAMAAHDERVAAAAFAEVAEAAEGAEESGA